jgi:hypothetical protein
VLEYAVVAAPRDAELVYNANLKVLPDDAVKLCVAVINCTLNEVHIACVIAITASLVF